MSTDTHAASCGTEPAETLRANRTGRTGSACGTDRTLGTGCSVSTVADEERSSERPICRDWCHFNSSVGAVLPGRLRLNIDASSILAGSTRRAWFTVFAIFAVADVEHVVIGIITVTTVATARASRVEIVRLAIDDNDLDTASGAVVARRLHDNNDAVTVIVAEVGRVAMRTRRVGRVALDGIAL